MVTRNVPRTKARIAADYRADKAARGECRECREPVATKVLKNGTTKKLKLCATHAAIDAARKAGAIRTPSGAT